MQTVNTRGIVATLVSLAVLTMALALADKSGADTGTHYTASHTSSRA